MEYFKGFSEVISKYKFVSLGDIAEFQYGLGESAQDSGDLVYIRITDIDEFGLLKKDDLKFVTEQESFGNSILQKGDILVARTGATYGKTLYFDEDFRATYGGFLIRIKLNTSIILPKFYFYFTHTSLYWNNAKQLVGGGGQPQFNANAVKQLQIPLPPLEIQNQIVEKMDLALKEKKQKELQAKTLLESIDDFVLSELGIEYKEVEEKKVFGLSLSELLESKRLDPKGYSVKFREIKNSIKNSKYKLEKIEKLTLQSIAGERGVDEGKGGEGFEKINVLRNTNFVNDKNFDYSDVAVREIEEKKFSRGILLNKGDLLVEKSGGSEVQPVGRVAIFDLDERNYSFSNFLHCFRIDKDKILPDYVFSYLKTIYRLGYMEYIQNQTTGIRNLIMENFLEIFIPLPPLEVQEKIALEVKNRIEKAKVLESEAKEVYERAKKEVEEMILD